MYIRKMYTIVNCAGVREIGNENKLYTDCMSRIRNKIKAHLSMIIDLQKPVSLGDMF